MKFIKALLVAASCFVLASVAAWAVLGLAVTWITGLVTGSEIFAYGQVIPVLGFLIMLVLFKHAGGALIGSIVLEAIVLALWVIYGVLKYVAVAIMWVAANWTNPWVLAVFGACIILFASILDSESEHSQESA